MKPVSRFRYVIECGTRTEKHVWYYDSDTRYDTMALAEAVCAQLRQQFTDLRLNSVTELKDPTDPPPVSDPDNSVRVWTYKELPVVVQPRLLGGR